MNGLTVSTGAVSGSVRTWLRAEGFLVLAASLFVYRHSGSSWWIFLALLLTPDLSMLSYLINPRIGANSYNVAHSYSLPLGLAMLATLLGRTEAIPYLFIWIAHIGMDRCLGYGLKYPTAFGRTHLGVLGSPGRYCMPIAGRLQNSAPEGLPERDIITNAGIGTHAPAHSSQSKETEMPKYLIEASYTAEGLRGVKKDKASGRQAAMEKLVTSVGGKLEAVYYAFGAADVFVLFDAPDAVSAAALSFTASATGLVKVKTIPLLTVAEADEALSKTTSYQAPGA